MTGEWTILHSGALGDLVLTIQLALRLPGVGQTGGLRVISRTNPGDLTGCRPSIVRQSSEGLGLHWLFGDHDDPAPERLTNVVRGARALSALGGVHTIVHHRLESLEPVVLYSIDPRPRDGVRRHITQQWQTQLEAQGLLVPKCVHQRPKQRGLGVPDTLRERGRRLLDDALGATSSHAGSIRSEACHARVAVIHPGSGGRAKCWALAGFVEVARQLRDMENLAVCFILGPTELEQWPAGSRAALEGEFAVLACTSAKDLGALLSGARLYVGNDSGPTHLAALLGTPTIGVFGATDASVWRLLGSHVREVIGDPGAGDHWGIKPEQIVELARAGG